MNLGVQSHLHSHLQQTGEGVAKGNREAIHHIKIFQMSRQCWGPGVARGFKESVAGIRANLQRIGVGSSLTSRIVFEGRMGNVFEGRMAFPASRGELARGVRLQGQHARGIITNKYQARLPGRVACYSTCLRGEGEEVDRRR